MRMTGQRWGCARGLCAGLVACAAGVMVAGCDEGVQFEPPPPPTVGVATPLVETVTPPQVYAGRLEGSAIVQIRPRVTGRLERVHFEPGEVIEAGDVLYTIERDLYEAERDLRIAEAERAAAAAKLAETVEAQVRVAFEQGAASEFELESAVAQHDEAVASAEAARAAVRAAETDLAYTVITAPVGGRVARSTVDEGNLVTANASEALTTIVREDPMYVYLNVPEREVLRYIQANPDRAPSPVPIRIELGDGRVYERAGVVDYASNEIDSASGTLEVRGRLENPDSELVSGYFVRVISTTRPREAVLVPELAVQRDLTGSFVYVVGGSDGGTAERRPVTTGPAIGGLRIIEDGLAGSDRVIVSGVLRVRPGGPVTIEEATIDPPPADLVVGGRGSVEEDAGDGRRGGAAEDLPAPFRSGGGS